MPVLLLGGTPGLPPNSIAGLVLWFDASVGVFSDAGTTPAVNNDPVQQWNDQSVSAHHASQGTLGQRPLLITNGVNGRPVVRFDTSDDFMTRTANNDDDLINLSAKTIFVVWKVTNEGDATQYAITFNDGSERLTVGRTTSGTGESGNDDGGGGRDVVTKAMGDAAFHVQTLHHAGGSLYIGVDDTRTASMSSTASGNTSVGANTNLFLRRFPAAAEVCDIAEIAMYNVALTEGERQSVEQYLAYKYGISLPY